MFIFKASRHALGSMVMFIGLQSLLSGQYAVGVVQVAYCLWLSAEL